MKRITINIDDAKHAQFKAAAAAAGFGMTEVISAAVDDYLSGKYRPKISKTQIKENERKPINK